jgi:hypothetical protein
MAKAPTALQIGNTTFRRPWRIPESLRALKEFNKNYNFKKNRISENYEAALINSISNTGVLESKGKIEGWKGGHGRKFLNLCQKFGFITPRPKNVSGKGIYDLNENGEDEFIINFLKEYKSKIKLEKFPFSLTPLGNMLAETTSDELEITSEQQDIFLKSLYYQQQPSILHSLGNGYKGEKIRPLQLFLKIFFELEKLGLEKSLSTGEISLVINTAWTNDVDLIVNEIRLFRKIKKGKERQFAKKWFEKNGGIKFYKARFDSIWTYADPNISYLVSTGLINKIGKKIILNFDKKDISKIIAEEDELVFKSDNEYLFNFWSGDLLPFENRDYIVNKAKINNEILIEKFNYQDKTILDQKVIKNKELSVLTTPQNKKDMNLLLKARTIVNKSLKNANLELDSRAIDIFTLKAFEQLKSTTVKKIIFKTEDKIKELNEIEFFETQKKVTKEILHTLQNIENESIIYNGVSFEPEPEHLEWIVWRAFLAINSFNNEIKNTRGFPVDENFLPTHHAAGGKEDLFFEFDDYCLLIEVTFKIGGSQFKDEVEPVFRHTANKMNKYKDKSVYCLFLAPKISLNLSNAFKGNYFFTEDKEISGNIIPMTIQQFTKLFSELFDKKKLLTPLILKDIFDQILKNKENYKTNEWLTFINNTINTRIKFYESKI